MNNSDAEFELLRSSPLFSNAEVLNDLGDSTRIWKIGDGVICKYSNYGFYSIKPLIRYVEYR